MLDTNASRVKELAEAPTEISGQRDIRIGASAFALRAVQNSGKWSAAGIADQRAAELMRSRSPLSLSISRVGDLVGGFILGVGFLPFIVPIALILLLSGQSAIYSQIRVGKGGRVFKCLKFRTMVSNAEYVLSELLSRDPAAREEWQRDHKLKDDPRITSIGRFLRRTSLDELPQILNVLKGDMSLVGPRPIVREELLKYGRWVSIYLAAKPGITGLWQVSGRNNMSYRRRVAIDVYYSRKRGLLLNLHILVKTIGVVMGKHGAY